MMSAQEMAQEFEKIARLLKGLATSFERLASTLSKEQPDHVKT